MCHFEGKKIVLGIPSDYGFSDVLEQEFKHQGFEVFNISYSRQGKFRYKNAFERINSFIHKNFLGRKRYKDYLKMKRAETFVKARLEQVTRADYALLIRPDQYSEEIIRIIQNKVGVLVAYQWDGLDRFPNVKPLVKYFSRFFVFDPADLDKQPLLPITNFYTNSFTLQHDETLHSDACFVGTYIPNRALQTEQLITTLQNAGLHVHYHICSAKKSRPPFKTLKTQVEQLTYGDNLKLAYNTNILIDINNQLHNGLSFRVFEAIGFQKKMITTSADVRKYDFYHPNNFFIWEEYSKPALEEFIAAPFVPLSAAVRQKYSFHNWVRYLLDEGAYEPITLPQQGPVEKNTELS